MNTQKKVVIAGVQGYVGRELSALVNAHPYLDLAGILCRQDQEELYQLTPHLQKLPLYSLEELIKHSAEIDIILLATPAKVSMDLVAALATTNINIIDLSGAFRSA